MPTLTWVGKNKVVNHHHDVPFRVLDKQYRFDAPGEGQDSPADNRIIRGDNLEALKSLLPEFEGKVDCIYIDPPYNTGNESWQYNDAVNDPKIKKWLGKVVGKEGEDLSRHDKWLCMVYPRLKLLHRLLAKDGVIFISIDDNELHHMRLIADEIFGSNSFVANIAAITNLKGRNDKKHVAACHEYILIYANRDFVSYGLPLSEAQRAAFKYVDQNEKKYALRDLRKRGGPDKRVDRPNMFFPLFWNESLDKFFLERSSQEDVEILPILSDGTEGRWRWGKEKIEANLAWLHAKRPNGKRSKRWGLEHRVYLDPSISIGEDDDIENEDDEDEEDALFERTSKPKSFWLGGEFSSDAGKRMFKAILPGKKFDFPKSIDLVKRCLQMGAPKDGLILDSFAGTGTTAHAVLKLNAEDGGTRRFILIETLDYAETLTAERVRCAITGYGEGKNAAPALGGGFDFYSIGEPIFLDKERLNESVGVDAIRRYVAYSEGVPPQYRVSQDNPYSPYLLGLNSDTAWLFHYEPNQATCLDLDFLGTLKLGSAKPGTAIIYADRCLLSKEFMVRHNIIFKKIPRDITRF